MTTLEQSLKPFLSDPQATLRELDKIDAQSLIEFLKLAWPVLEPGQPYIHGWHMDAMAEHLEAVKAGQINRLLINIPPGTSKSTITSVMFPAWLWGPAGQPSARIIGASHEQGLAIRDNRKTRILVESEWYQERWPVQITSDQNEKSFFETEKRGFRQATAVASMTGRRGDCLTGDTLVMTENGELPIKNIVNDAKSCNVLSYDRNTERLVYRPIQAVARRAPKEIYRVHTSCGVMVECSGDHKFYTARGYVEARLLSSNDLLLRAVRHGIQKDGVSTAQSGAPWRGGDFLQSEVLDNSHEHKAREGRPVLQHLRHENFPSEREAAVLGSVPQGGVDQARGASKGGLRACRMSGMRDGNNAEVSQLHAEVLFERVQGERPFSQHEGGRESGLAGRRRSWPLPSAGSFANQQDALENIRSGSARMRGVRQPGGLDDAPHRSRHEQQSPGQFGDDVQEVSREMACCGEAKAATVSVAMVERLCKKEALYDIQVADTRCFFANGILVHNCVIWDDPHSPEKAYSEKNRETTIRIFKETLPTRLVNPDRSAIIVVMQRLHEKDVSGHILSEDLGYDHLMLPMEFEPDRKCYTSIGWEDPRTKEGELLFPERFPRDVVERDKRVMGKFAIAGQYQQRPAPRSGGIIERSWWGQWDHRLHLPPFEHIVMSLDTAFTESTGADYSAGSVWGLYRRNKTYGILLLDCWQERLSLPDLIDKVKEEMQCRYGGTEQAPLLKPMWGPDRALDTGRAVDTLIIEDKGSGISLRQMLSREGIHAYAYNPGRADKLSRLHAVSHLFAAGMIYAPESNDPARRGKFMGWAEELIEQVCTYSGKGSLANDDLLDSTTQALRYLADLQRLSTTEEMDDPDEGRDYTKKRGNPYG